MSVARFIADQRTKYRVPHTVYLRAVGCQRVLVLQVGSTGDPDGVHTDSDRRRAQLDAAVGRRSSPPRGCTVRRASIADLRRAGLAGVGEDGRRVDAPPRPGGAQDPSAARD